MISDKIFQVMLVLSAALHVAALCQGNSFFGPTGPNTRKNEDPVEINYLKLLKYDIAQAKEQGPRLEIPLSLPSRIAAEKRAPPPFIEQQNVFRQNNSPLFVQKSLFAPAVLKKPEIKPDIIAVKKRISLPHVDIDKINNPSYVSYYQIIREKIRRCAYQNYSTSDTGEVYISFIISNTGYLEEKRLVEDKSSAKTYLRDIALKSVSDASPFPKFPTELDYSQLSFNVIISFEIE